MVMKKLVKWFKTNRDTIIRNSFLLPILLVVIMSISHVVSWYDLGNPMSWAIYLSVAIEIFALASVAAASIDIKKGSIWFLFGLVTFIQIVGNIFFEYQDININDPGFLSWVELIEPVFVDWDIIDHRRLLATVQGGTLPLMSLTALHFFIKFTEKKLKEEKEPVAPIDSPTGEEMDESIKQYVKEDGTIDAAETVTEILKDELDKAVENENELEKIETELEYIDEDSFLSDDESVDVTTVLESSNDNRLSDTLNELDNIGKSEEDVPESLNESDTEDNEEGNGFGPPHINNGNIS